MRSQALRLVLNTSNVMTLPPQSPVPWPRNLSHLILSCLRYFHHCIDSSVSGQYYSLSYSQLFTTSKGAKNPHRRQPKARPSQTLKSQAKPGQSPGQAKDFGLASDIESPGQAHRPRALARFNSVSCLQDYNALLDLANTTNELCVLQVHCANTEKPNSVLLLMLVLLSWTHPNGQLGLLHVFMVITHLLQNQEVLGRLMIGNLIIHLFRCAGKKVLLDLPDLLQAMLVQMQMAQMAMFLQSLVVPFAYLVYRHHNATLNQLEATHLGQWYIPYISPYVTY
ncbi:hypothetical protein EDB85DRAFT_1896641 [Lactarius pseudohatsudake]|nr:hypothetical protein EDB85DRAFT_1896641 [Lactarius pseudohatsudake]